MEDDPGEAGASREPLLRPELLEMGCIKQQRQCGTLVFGRFFGCLFLYFPVEV
ncbi:MAG: hypothetical protein DDT21_01772 [Syntrophomonadaceae bacterium]|nr:hypothetical protein [Bacillota bacterium]